jgi:hypothetical protein
MITAIHDRLVISPQEFALFMRIDLVPEDTTQLEEILSAAKRQADHFCQNLFSHTDEAGIEVLEDIPADIKLAGLRIAATLYESRTDHISSENIAGLSYQTGQIHWSAQRLLFPYRKFFAV